MSKIQVSFQWNSSLTWANIFYIPFEAITALTTKVPEGSESSQVSSDKASYYNKKTKAEIDFLIRRKEKEITRINEKVKVSHKERVENFNLHLNRLSDHFEQSKVSWNKWLKSHNEKKNKAQKFCDCLKKCACKKIMITQRACKI